VFILWSGLGDAVTVAIVFYAALFPMLLNTWTGVRAVNPLWLRAAQAMGAGERALFWKVIIPGASPLIITGLRQAFIRSWIAVVGAEMLAASDWGLGWIIFDAKEFLNADVMLASLAVIGAIGYVFERFVFGSLERFTVLRWGMVRAAKAWSGTDRIGCFPSKCATFHSSTTRRAARFTPSRRRDSASPRPSSCVSSVRPGAASRRCSTSSPGFSRRPRAKSASAASR
jgi:hypothetical protein